MGVRAYSAPLALWLLACPAVAEVPSAAPTATITRTATAPIARTASTAWFARTGSIARTAPAPIAGIATAASPRTATLASDAARERPEVASRELPRAIGTASAPAAAAPTPWAVPLTLPTVEVREVDGGAAGRLVQRLIPALPEESAPLWGALLLVTVMALAVAAGRWLRNVLPAAGLLARAAGIATHLARAGLLLAVLALVPRLLPDSLAPVLPWTLVAAAMAIGWSLRDVLPDVVAGVTLALEHRVPLGSWVECQGRRGVVERRSLRATWLRDSAGRSISIPNRLLLREVVIDGDAVLHEASVRVSGDYPASEVRRAIVDAVATSPWVRPSPAPSAHRDGVDGAVWRVRAPLITPALAERFDGELLDRVQAELAAREDDHAEASGER